MKSLLLAAVLIPVAFVSAAHADDDDRRRCGNVPIGNWMSEADLRAKIAPLGLEIREIDIDDGCYEVEARNRDGRRVEIGFHPQTGDQVWVDGDD